MRKRHTVLGFLFLLSVITYIDRVCISVAGPRMQEDLNMSPEQWGWVVGAFALAYAIFEIPTGAMGDSMGPRRVITRIVLWWSAFTTLTGAVSSYTWLLIVRFLFGAGEAGAYPNISATISRWFPVAERARSHGITWMASRIGGAVSPLLVVPIQLAFGWRASFFVFGLMGVIWCIFWFKWFRDDPRKQPGITEAEIEEIGPPQAAHHSGLPWGKMLSNPQTWLILVMYHTYCWGAYFYLSWLHTYLQKGRGLTEAELGIFSSFPFIAGALANLGGGLLSDRLVRRYGLKIGRRSVGSAGLFLSGLFLVATGLTTGKVTGVLFLTLGFAAMDAMLPVAWAVCLDVGGRHAGAVTGAMNMAGQVGSFISSVLFGYAVTYFGSYNTPVLFMAGMVIVSAMLFLLIDPTKALFPEREQVDPQQELPKAA